MTDLTTTNFADFMYEMRGTWQENFGKQFVFSAEMKRNTARENFSGNYVRVPQMLNILQGGGAVGEGGTVNTPQAPRTAQAHIPIAELVQPFAITLRADWSTADNSAIQAQALLVKEARIALEQLENDFYLGNGDALLAKVASGTGSPGLTIPLQTQTAGATGIANFDQLFPGRIIDVKTRSNGADPGQGLKRLISSISETNTTITLDTTSYGGGSGNVTFSANEGVYIDGSYGTGVAPQGIQQVRATSGTFESIDKAAVQVWQGTDGRGGDTTITPLTIGMLDSGVRRLLRSGIQIWDFAVGDPAVIHKFAQGLYVQSEWAGDSGKLETGFDGIYYNKRLMIPERFHDIGALTGIHKESLNIYAKDAVPSFIDDTGAMFMRFSRTLDREAWLYDPLQLGAMRCNTTISFRDLTRAS